MIAHLDLSESHGHRDDHGFTCGAEFNVKTRRRINIPDFVRDQLSEDQIDDIWWEQAGQARNSLRETLARRYKWIGEMRFVGRGPGWLAIEDTGCRPRNWESIGKIVEQHLKSFIKSMESPSFWRDIMDINPTPAMEHHATRKSPAQLQREIDEVLTKPVTASGVPSGLMRTTVKSADQLDSQIAPALGKTPAQLVRAINSIVRAADGRNVYLVSTRLGSQNVRRVIGARVMPGTKGRGLDVRLLDTGVWQGVLPEMGDWIDVR